MEVGIRTYKYFFHEKKEQICVPRKELLSSFQY